MIVQIKCNSLFCISWFAANLLLCYSRELWAADAANQDQSSAYHVVDTAAQEFQKLVGANSCTIAISRGGKLLHSAAFGTLDQAGKTPLKPDDLMRIASVTKPLTHALVNELFLSQKLANDDDILSQLPPELSQLEPTDTRWKRITLKMLLEHRGGWDREQAYDPMFALDRVRKKLELNSAPTNRDIIRFMLLQPLQFDPDTRSAYSNFGYCLLGRAIEKATKSTYLEALQHYVLEPHRIEGIVLSRSKPVDRPQREVEYPAPTETFDIEVMDAHGGLSASAPALCKFLSHYWISGERRKANDGPQNWLFFGSLPGTTALVRQKNGWDVAILWNNRRDATIDEDLQNLRKNLDQALDRLTIPQPDE